MADSIHKKTDQDLEKILIESHRRLEQFRFDLAGGKVTKVKEGRTLRRQIARVLTVLNQRSKEKVNK